MQTSKRLEHLATREQYLTAWSNLAPGTPSAVDFVLSLPACDSPARCLWQACDGGEELLMSVEAPVPLLERAYLEAFAELASGLSWNKLAVLGTRELENFLRDNNHTPSHGNDPAVKTPGLWLEQMRQPLFTSWLEFRLARHLPSLESTDSAVSLATWLSAIDSHVWGKRVPEPIRNSCAGSLVPLDGVTKWEIQWRFLSDIESWQALALCQALESCLDQVGLGVKVVAES